MARIVLARATQAAVESALRQLMPMIDDRLATLGTEVRLLRDDVRALDAKVDSLRDEMLDRFERTVALVNEVAHRVTRVEGKLERYMEAMRGIVLPAHDSRKKRAG